MSNHGYATPRLTTFLYLAALTGLALFLAGLVDFPDLAHRNPALSAAPAVQDSQSLPLPPPPITVVSEAVLDSVAVATKTFGDQQRCLAQTIYFEARGEPLEGQVAVAQVVLNRLHSPRYPSTICAVVFQNERRRNRCQFSFACDGRSDNPHEARAWERARRAALLVLTREVVDFSAAATHYHANYVTPYWASRLHATARVGRHVFYRE